MDRPAGWNSSKFVRARLQAALYHNRERRKERQQAQEQEEQEPEEPGEEGEAE